MGAPPPELHSLWLARASTRRMSKPPQQCTPPKASIVQIDEVHGGTTTARGPDGIRQTLSAYIGLSPHMEALTTTNFLGVDLKMTARHPRAIEIEAQAWATLARPEASPRAGSPKCEGACSPQPESRLRALLRRTAITLLGFCKKRSAVMKGS